MNSSLSSTEVFTITSRKSWLAALIVFATSFSFALYTNHAWEDWYITYRASKNLATGNGLVFSVGERVHSFTSPLGTLIPALLKACSSNITDSMVLWIYRIIGCCLLAVASVMLLRIARAMGMFVLPTAVLIGMFATDGKIIDFSINGQETALMLFFLVSIVFILSVPAKKAGIKLGLAWGGLMWTRPDSFVYILGLSLGYLLFVPETPNYPNRKAMLKGFCQAGMLAAAVYLPWLLWTWSYYGTPVPHTVVAKGLFAKGMDFSLLAKLVMFPFTVITGSSSVADTFMPSYYHHGGWSDTLLVMYAIVAGSCALYWCLPRTNSIARAVSFSCFLAHFYLTAIVPVTVPWYLPNVAVLSMIVIGQLFQHAVSVSRKCLQKWPESRLSRLAQPSMFGVAVLLLAVTVVMTCATGFQLKLQQDYVENGNRKLIGIWLKENASGPKDTVFLECLGYIGFYSQLKMFDYPGLSSPEVVAARRKLGVLADWGDYAEIIKELKPDWLVLRPFEAEQIMNRDPLLLTMIYNPVKVFDVSDRLKSHAFIPGRPYLEMDQSFAIFRRFR